MSLPYKLIGSQLTGRCRDPQIYSTKILTRHPVHDVLFCSFLHSLVYQITRHITILFTQLINVLLVFRARLWIDAIATPGYRKLEAIRHFIEQRLFQAFYLALASRSTSLSCPRSTKSETTARGSDFTFKLVKVLLMTIVASLSADSWRNTP